MLRPQARSITLLALLVLSGCAVPGQLDLRRVGRDISGAAQEARLPPPGLDRPPPNLASVPPIPERPNPATRLAVTQGLQAQRDLLNTPLPDRRADSPLAEGAAPGQPSIPAGPPRPAVLARAPVIPWTTGPALRPAASSQMPTPEASSPEARAPESVTPGEVPELPSADLLGAPPPMPSLGLPRR
jgi:hypothetical protein